MAWVEACGVGDIDEEDVIRWDHEGRSFALYRSPGDEYFATAFARMSACISPTAW
jgi:3-phenylpropionate/trans-cinnamate dioxygenase ferredoxin subunit